MVAETIDQPAKKIDSSVDVFGLPMFSGGMEGVLTLVKDYLDENGSFYPLVIYTPNPEQVVLARENDLFCTSLLAGDIRVPDGMGLVVADWLLAKRFGRQWRLRERVDGVSLMQDICAEAAKRDKKVFLLGASSQTNKAAVKTLAERYAGLKVGGFSGPQNVNNATTAEIEMVFEKLAQDKPEVLFVAFGAPAQELFVNTHRERLGRLGVKVVMVVGGALDMVAGKLTRAPLWMRKIGLEWLWRLVLEPWRWRRQLRLLKFVGWVFLKLAKD